MTRARSLLVFAVLALIGPRVVWAVDPPHGNLANLCQDCHVVHNAPGMSLTKTAGNNNLCRSCHALTTNPVLNNWAPGDQAVPGTSGKMHRWDALAVNSAYDAQEPLDSQLLSRLEGYTSSSPNKKVMCSTCHNQHSQANPPPDLGAPVYGGPGTGWGRHYQRIANDTNQMCRDCHRARDVTSSSGGSHPIRVSIPPSGPFQSPASLTLIGGQVYCTTCHSPHNATSGGANSGLGDGYLLDDSIGNLCYQCHTLGDAATASHLSTTSGVLWPGGQYGSTRPAAPAAHRGACVNCHWPHGQRDDANPSQDFPKLWAERYDASRTVAADPDDAEDLCFTCHDGSPAGTNIMAEITRGTNTTASVFHHPVKDSEQSLYGRSVECVDCHNPHKATATNRLKGVSGVDISGNPVGPGTSNDRDIVERELCFKCHGDTYSGSRTTSNKRLDFQTTNSAYHPVAGQGQNQSLALSEQFTTGSGLTTSSIIKCTDCHNNPATRYADGVGLPWAYGPAANSTARPKGPHGADQQRSSTQSSAFILRAYYNTSLTGPTSFNADEFRLCFLCHDVAKLVTARQYGDGARTNFYDTINGKDNLHWVHLVDRASKTSVTCKNCHYNVHSNRQTGAEGSVHTTQYQVDGTVYASGPPSGFKTRNVSFSPDVLPIGTRAKPELWINTTSRERRCYLDCHGTVMNGYQYRGSGTYDNDPLVACVDGDGDGYFLLPACGSPNDCDDANPNVNPGAPENTAATCTDGINNDCDGATDCADSGCAGVGGCPACTDSDLDNYYAELSCNNPNDCDDANPNRNPGISESTFTLCHNSIDNDCDGLTDCADPNCTSQCEDTQAECSNGADNDGDGRVDCHDTSCWTNGGGAGTSCVSTQSGNNRNCCRPVSTSYACYRTECNGRACDRGGTCDVY